MKQKAIAIENFARARARFCKRDRNEEMSSNRTVDGIAAPHNGNDEAGACLPVYLCTLSELFSVSFWCMRRALAHALERDLNSPNIILPGMAGNNGAQRRNVI